ncbi:protein furry isoform X3 [Chironomus tepperi]|uniref:protein furry isoform X3 n=1 Tax=Chironomus tepperi TaxID=113505 RepID=UPI00391F5A01
MENDFTLRDDSLKIDFMFDQNVYIRSSLLSRILSKLGHSSSYSLSQSCSGHQQSDSLTTTSENTIVSLDSSAGNSPLGKSLKTDYDDELSNQEIDIVKSPIFNTIPLSTRSSLLPWSPQNRSSSLAASGFSTSENMFGSTENLRPGEIVMRILFADFTLQAEKKIEGVMLENSEKQISKILQRGEDTQFDQLLSALGSVAEHCLPSLLRALLAWHRRQISDAEFKTLNLKKSDIDWNLIGTSSDLEIQLQRREAAVEFIFCLVLLEVLKQLPFHPGNDDIIKNIENLAFRHFKYREGIQNCPNAYNIHIIADLYGEVVGTLAQSRFASIKKRFMSELKELRSKEPSPHTTQSIISLLMGMKFFRVKMVPIEEFEASFQFMHECAQYFLEVKDKDIKHALAGLFVEILVPVAAAVKNEVNVPCVKNFVDLLYSPTLDACTKNKHRLALFPLLTCLLCVSQKTFFLNNWHYFLAMCLSNLKNRDQKMSRVALESLYRLLWVYMIRIKCESNQATHSRLQSIVNSLFPRGSKAVVPRDMPLNIFVKIIQFIAQERLDFSMREIVFELLWVGRPIKIIMTPERMSIGLRAFLVVADSLQQKDGEPPMPRTIPILPSGNTLRVKKTYLTKLLTEDMAKSIGIHNYFPHVRRVFVDILRALDASLGRPFMMTNTQNVNKEPEELLTGERKPKIDLFRTCIAAIPRLIPDNISQTELVDLLARCTVHMDEELSGLAYQSLQTLVKDFPDWRQHVIQGFTQFLSRDVNDTFHQLLDNGLKMLHLLLNTWKVALEKLPATTQTVLVKSTAVPAQASNDVMSTYTTTTTMGTIATVISAKDSGYISSQTNQQHSIGTTSTNSSVNSNSGIHPLNSGATSAVPNDVNKKQEVPISTTLNLVEGLALVTLCNYRAAPRRLAVHILKEVKSIMKLLGLPETEPPLIDVIDKCCPKLLDSLMTMLPQSERTAILNANVIDLQWIIERNSNIWSVGYIEESVKTSATTLSSNQLASNNNNNSTNGQFDPWAMCLFGFMERNNIMQQCPIVVAQAWPLCYQRIQSLYTIIDPTPVSDNRASLLRSSTPAKKPLTESQRDSFVNLWKNQIKMAMRLIPSVVSPVSSIRCASPDLSLSSSPDSMNTDRNDKNSSGLSTAMYKLIVPLLRCEVADIRDAAVNALGLINPDALKDLMEELVPYIREAVDKKQENMRRRRRRDALRLQLVKVLKLIAENGTFGESSCVLERDTLHPTFVDYMEGARLYLEAEIDKDNSNMREVKIHFCDFIRIMIKNFSLETCNTLLSRDLKRNLFNLFTSWCGQYAKPLGVSSNIISTNPDEEKLQFSALQAMSALLCCGACFDTQNLSEDGNIYSWLDLLLTSSDDKIYQLGKDTVVLLLECNPDAGMLLEWVIDRCYTATSKEADACFFALASIFNVKEYPCDHYTSVIAVTLVMCGCPRVEVQTTALQLLQILDKRFFGTTSVLQGEKEKDDKNCTLDGALDKLYCRSQMYLSRQMSRLRPEMTMPMFSEITYRFQTARTDVRFLLLQCLLPWLENMELLASNVPPTVSPLSYIMYYPDSGLKGRRDGAGSTEATEMILNNLFYITAKFSDSHGREIEELWGILSQCWPNNLKVILRYLVIISGLAPNELLCYTKRVALYLARSAQERFLDELMIELQTVETLNCLIERTEHPPFYRLTSMRKTSSHSDGAANNDPKVQEVAVEKGTIHTKRHAKNDDDKGTCKSDSALRALMNSNVYRPPRGSDKIRTASGPSVLPPRHEDIIIQNENEIQSMENNLQTKGEHHHYVHPHPLPMPEYGGYFAPLNKILPDTNLPISGFHRCNVAVMLLTEIVIDGINGIDWTLHLPLMLHILFLGLDHTRNTVRDHCKQLLLNLLFVQSKHNDHLGLAKIMLNSQTKIMGLGLACTNTSILSNNFTEFDQEFDSYMLGPTVVPVMLGQSQTNLGANDETNTENENAENVENVEIPTIVTEENPIPQTGPLMDISHVIKSLVMFLTQENLTQPLWNYEDITAKVWACKSAEQLTCFTRHIAKIFSESHPQSSISERWAQTALQLGLSCSSRHYAGRCLQIFRALNVPINSRMLSDILSRLVETVAEQGEDMQGYVTELLLTLEAAVDSLDSDFRPLDVMKDIFKSTPNLNNKEVALLTSNKRASDGNQVSPLATNNVMSVGNHARSTSYSVTYCAKKTANLPMEVKELRNRTATNIELERTHSKFPNSLSRSRSAQSLKFGSDTTSQDDKMTILAQLFWLGVSLLESDYEHEFLLALRLLSRVLHRLPLDRPDARDKVERLQNQLKWNNYPGVHALLLKGCTHSVTYEPSAALLSQLIPILNLPVCDPTQSSAFAMNVIALLPYMLLNYDSGNEICIQSAENIAQVATEMGSKLENLGTVMTLYSRKTFSKESFQWTKCVIKYLHDTYAHLGINMLAFLIEVLEKAQQVQLQVLSVIHCLLHYVELSTPQAQIISSDLLRVVAKHLDSPNWREALKILKLIVTRSSTLVLPQASSSVDRSTNFFQNLHGSYSDSEVFCKKELAGRTMDFSYDVSQTPLIGRRLLLKPDLETNVSTQAKISQPSSSNIGGTSSPRRSTSLSPADTAPLSGWKRPWMSQSRVRECLVNLLTACGQRVGLPKSPSVIFSQSSDLLERQSSASSTEDTSGAQQDLSGGSRRDDGPPDFGVFKDFDFLEYESESIEGESTDNFNWGVRRRPLSEGDSEPLTKTHSNVNDESISEKTPVMSKKRRVNPDDSSDEEAESPLDEDKPSFQKSYGAPALSLSLRERRRRDSVSRSDTSGSSAGDLDITPCNASPHLPGMLTFRASTRDESEESWRKSLLALLVNQPSSHPPILLHQLYKLIRELTIKCNEISKDCIKYFTGNLTPLGNRISILSDLLSSKGEPPKLWYNQGVASTPRLVESLRYSVLEIQEHLETFFDRKDHVMEGIESIKSSMKFNIFGDVEQMNESTSSTDQISLDPGISEILIDLGRGLYKLMFQLLLLIEADHKIAIQIYQNLQKNELMYDMSEEYLKIKGAILRSIDDVELESLDTSTSTEGESTTPTHSSPLPMNTSDFENTIYELIDKQRWHATIQHVKQYKQVSDSCSFNVVSLDSSLCEEPKSSDELSIIMNVYAESLTKHKNDAFIISRSELELNEIYSILMENLYYVTAAIQEMELNLKTSSNSTVRIDTDVTTL